MPADLVPHSEIAALAACVSPELIAVLRRIHREEFIPNGSDLDEKSAEALRRLADLRLVDPGYAGDEQAFPSMLVINGNGTRVLGYTTGIRGGPYYEVPSVELASWLEGQGADRWWNVDGDPLLTGRLTFPCPAAGLAADLRTINRPLLIQARKEDPSAKGQVIGAAKIGDAVSLISDNVPTEGRRLRGRKIASCICAGKDPFTSGSSKRTARRQR